MLSGKPPSGNGGEESLAELLEYMKALDKKYDFFLFARRANRWRLKQLREIDEEIALLLEFKKYELENDEIVARAFQLLNREHELLLDEIEAETALLSKALLE